MNNLFKISLITLFILSASANAVMQQYPIEDTIEAGLQAMIDQGLMPQLDTTETLGGVDVDADGLRDDIKAWIDTLAINNDQKQATIGNAKAMQTIMLVDLNDATAVDNAFANNLTSIVCMVNVFYDDFDKANEIRRNIQSYTANTILRSQKSIAYNNKLGGSVSGIPTCPH